MKLRSSVKTLHGTSKNRHSESPSVNEESLRLKHYTHSKALRVALPEMNITKHSITVFLVMMIVMILMAPLTMCAGNGGSGYSRFGIGDLRYYSSSRSAGMGYTGIGMLSTNTIEEYNPASWSTIERTRFSLGILFEGFNTTDGSSSAFLSGTHFNGITLAIPISIPSGIVFGAGIIPYSSINYHILTPATSNNVNYNLEYSGDGGISKGLLGFSWKPGTDIYLGSSFDYYFGTLRHTVAQTFFTSDQYTDAEELRALEVKGVGATFGLIYSGFSNMLHFDTTRSLTVGLTVSTGSAISASEEHYYKYKPTSTTIPIYDTTSLPDQDLSLPYRMGIGATFRTSEFMVAGDFFYSPWESFSGSGIISGDLRNSYRISVGGDLFPKREGTTTWFERLSYRAGLYYNASYYKPKNTPINEFGITTGFGIPIFMDTRMNLSVEYSFRGTTDLGLQKDKILRFTLSLDGSELWFQRPEEQ